MSAERRAAAAITALTVASLIWTGCGGGGDSGYWEPDSAPWQGKPVFTEGDVELGGVTEAAAKELEECGFDSDETARSEVVRELPPGSKVAVIAGPDGSLSVEDPFGSGIPTAEGTAVSVYEVHCTTGGTALPADFIAEADTVCAAHNEELGTVAGNAKSIRDTLAPYVQDQLDRLRGLGDPEEGAEEWNQLLDDAQAALDELKATPTFEGGDPFAEVNRKARDLGLKNPVTCTAFSPGG